MGKRISLRWQAVVMIALFSLALGFAVSAAMDLHYLRIWATPADNYLNINGHTLLRGLLLAVPAFGAVLLLHLAAQRFSFASFALRKTEKPGRQRLFFAAVWSALVLCWLPYLLTFSPGGLVGDAAETLECALGYRTVDSLFGLAQIYVFRAFIAIGKWFSPDINTGVFLYALCSMFLYAGACAAVVTELRRRGVPGVLLVVTAAVYAVSGHYASFSISLWKDSLFGTGVVMLSLLLWKEPKQGEKQTGWAVKTVLVLLFLCFWRNLISIVLLVAGILLFLIRRRRNLLALLMVVVSLVTMFVKGPVVSWAGIRGSRSFEAMGLPLQQTGAAIYNGAELSAEQEKELYRILPKEDWKEYYRPATSDTLKSRIDRDYVQEHPGGLIRAWMKLMPRNLSTYVKAGLMETLGFWLPYGGNKGSYFDWFVGVEADHYNRGYTEKDLILSATGATLAPALKERLPFVPSGTAAWILLLSAVLVMCQKKDRRKRMTALLPYLLCWVTILLTTPIAFSYRYVEMLAMGLPLFVFMPWLREETPGNGLIPGKEPGKIRKTLYSGALTAAIAGIAAAVFIIWTVTGAVRVGGFRNGKIEIPLTGPGEMTKYYIREGIAGANQYGEQFEWTQGDRVTVDFETEREEAEVEVSIHVKETFNGPQGYEILGGEEEEEITYGSVEGEDTIVFRLKPEGKRILFTVMLPDAIAVSEAVEGSGDDRVIAVKIDRMIIRRTGEEEL